MKSCPLLYFSSNKSFPLIYSTEVTLEKVIVSGLLYCMHIQYVFLCSIFYLPWPGHYFCHSACPGFLMLSQPLAVCRYGHFILMKRGVGVEWCFVCVPMSHMLQKGMEQFPNEWLCTPCSISWSSFIDVLHREPPVAGLNWLNHLIARVLSDRWAGLVDHVGYGKTPITAYLCYVKWLFRQGSGLCMEHTEAPSYFESSPKWGVHTG